MPISSGYRRACDARCSRSPRRTGSCRRMASRCCARSRAQCFVNEYVSGASDEERHRGRGARRPARRGAGAGADVPPQWIAAVAAYHPLRLASRRRAAGRAHDARTWPADRSRRCLRSRSPSRARSGSCAPRSRASPRSRTRLARGEAAVRGKPLSALDQRRSGRTTGAARRLSARPNFPIYRPLGRPRHRDPDRGLRHRPARHRDRAALCRCRRARH